MNTGLKLIALYSGLLLLQACSTGSDRLGGSIADIELETSVLPTIEEINPQVNFEIDDRQLIDSYRELVEASPPELKSGKEVQRLADLELETSLDNKLSENPEVALQGEQQAQLAIQRYEQYLQTYPDKTDNDKILYQLSRAYAVVAQNAKADHYLDRIASEFPHSRYIDEVQFRRGENLFVSGRFAESEQAYAVVVNNHPGSIYYEKSLYKLGWTQFKLNNYEQAIHSYIRLLDLKQSQYLLDEFDLSASLSRVEQELMNDVLRVTSLAFSYLPQRQPLSQYFNRYGKRPYEPLLYRRLGELYTRQERFSDASDIYLWFGEFYPFSRYTPILHDRAIDSLQKAGFASSILPEKERYVKLYNIGTRFWLQQDLDSQSYLKPRLAEHISEIATHYHAIAGKTKKVPDYAVAAGWYQLFLKSFPQHVDASRMNFLLAETLYEAEQYDAAILEYEKTAYEYAPHKHSAEAGFAVFYAYDRLYQSTALENKSMVNQRLIKSSLLYSDRFSYDSRMPAILIKTAENFYALKEYAKALEVTQLMVTNPSLERATHHRAWVVMGHSAYAEKRYDLAEKAYSESIKTRPRDAREELNLDEQLAQSIYRQGEQARAQGNHSQAALHFIRVAKLVPESPTRIIADYDAATEYMTLKHWPAAIVLLENFRLNHKDQGKWELGVSEKLALAYSSSGKHLKAADEMLKLVKTRPPEQQQDLLWQAAEHYTQAGEQTRAIEIYKTYIGQYPYPLARSIELRHKIAQFYQASNNTGEYHHWLNEIVKADTAAKDQRSDRSRYLAALASLELTVPVHKNYSAAQLTAPLKKSLAIKKDLMKSAIDAYTAAARYQIEEVTTAATFNIAEIYREFAGALLKSERPNKLNEEELEEYNYLLEDQAYPFEEKSIQIHESNLARIPAGSFDASIQKSLQALGKLLPFRYAKNELTESYAF